MDTPDHSNFISALLSCCIYGAKIIEKHVTFNRNSYGADHKASISIKNFGKNGQ